MSALAGARDRQEDWETAGSFVDKCRVAVRQVASWLNHAASRARAGLNLFKLQVPVLGTTCHIMHVIGTRARAASMRDSYHGIIYHDMIL